MNLIKASIAAVAVTVCCMGNDYPANAELSRNELHSFRAGQHYGYALGLVASACLLYGEGSISRTTLQMLTEIANELDDTTPFIRRRVSKIITENSGGKYKACVPTVRSVMGAPANTNRYQRANHLY